MKRAIINWLAWGWPNLQRYAWFCRRVGIPVMTERDRAFFKMIDEAFRGIGDWTPK